MSNSKNSHNAWLNRMGSVGGGGTGGYSTGRGFEAEMEGKVLALTVLKVRMKNEKTTFLDL